MSGRDMIRRGLEQQDHDAVVRAAEDVYEQYGKHAHINPGQEKNYSWNGYWIDIIVPIVAAKDDRAWVIEVETADSVTDESASGQWRDYDIAYAEEWYLAVPVTSKAKAETLLGEHGITHYRIVTWAANTEGGYTFWGLPGI